MTEQVLDNEQIDEAEEAANDAIDNASGDTVDENETGKDSSGKSIAEGNDEGKPTASTFPDNWQEVMAGGDDKVAKQLGRYASPEALAKAAIESKERIRRGFQAPEAPGKDASEKDIAAYRDAIGIPKGLEGYIEAVQMPDGITLGDDDKPIFDTFAKDLHDANLPPSALGVITGRYMKMQEEAATLQEERDEEFRISSMADLNQEMGVKFKANMAALQPYFDGVSTEIFDNLMGGRMADGSRIGDNPDAIRFFVAKALDENPASTVVPAGENQSKAIKDEIASIEKQMSEDRVGWFKDKAGQDRYRELLEAQEKLEK